MAYENNPQDQNPKDKDKDQLERALTALRGDQPDQETMQAAGQRVWQRLGEAQASTAISLTESIQGCEDVRALLPQHRAGKIPSAKALLVADHLRECVACRKE